MLLNKLMIGSVECTKAYLGSNVIFTSAPPVIGDIVRASNTASGNLTSNTVSIPSGAVVGDTLLLVISGSIEPAITGAWDAVQNATIGASSPMRIDVYAKTCESGDPGTLVTVTTTGVTKKAMAVVALNGVTTDAIQCTLTGYDTSSNTRVIPTLTANQNSVPILIAADRGAGADPNDGIATSSFTWPGGYTSINHVATGSGVRSGDCSLGLAIGSPIAEDSLVTPGSVTMQYTNLRAMTGLVLLDTAAQVTPPSDAIVDWVWTGAVTDDGYQVKAKVSDTTDLSLIASTASDLSSPTYHAVSAPDEHNIVTATISDKPSDTRLYCRLVDGSTPVGPTGTNKTLQATGTPFVGTRKIALGACVTTNTTNVLGIQNATAWTPDYGIYTGDFFYNGGATEDTSVWVEKYNSQIANVDGYDDFVAAGLASFEVISDHDTTNIDNGDSNTAWASYEQEAWRAVVPHPEFTESDVRDQVWDDGRIGFYLTDTRSPQRTSGNTADNSSKTMLGSGQKARLLSWLSDNEQPFKVVVTDPPWMGSADIVAKPDAWWAYDNERQQIIDAIQEAIDDADNSTKHVELWHGDSHLIGYATASKNTWGGFPVICAAAYASLGGGRNSSTYSAYFNNGGENAQHYGRMTFTDDGETITRTFSGWDAITDTEKVSDTVSVDTTDTPPPDDSGILMSFDSLTDGNTISTILLGDPWEIGGTAAPVASTAAAIHGARGARWASTGTYGYVGYTAPAVFSSPVVLSFYFNPKTFSSANHYIAGIYTAAGSTAIADFRINPTRTVAMRNGGTAVATSSATLTASTVYRAEWKIDPTTSTQTLRVYAGESTIILLTLNGAYTQSSGIKLRCGPLAAAAGGAIDYDTIRVASDWTGPYVA